MKVFITHNLVTALYVDVPQQKTGLKKIKLYMSEL